MSSTQQEIGDTLPQQRDAEPVPESAPGPESVSRPGPSPRSNFAAELTALRETLERRGAEIDGLQIDAARRSRPFYREPAVIVAALALVVSLVATILAQGNSITDRQISQRGRLTTIIKEINDWHEMTLDTQTYGLQYETGVRPALNEASFLIGALESTELRSTAPEKTTVSLVLREVYEPVLSVELARQAELQSRNGTLAEQVLTLRNLGDALYSNNKQAEGNVWFQRTVDRLDANAGILDRAHLAAYFVAVHEQWAYAALNANDCATATNATVAARADFARFPLTGPGSYVAAQDGLEGQLRSLCRIG